MSKESLLLQPIQVGGLTLKNRIMFPPLTTAYEERDGSIGTRSLAFYERLAKGGVAYISIGDVAPVMTASPTPKLFDDSQIPTFKRLADTVHAYDCKVGLQIFHPEYDVPAVGRLIMASRKAGMEAQEAKAKGDMALFAEKMAEAQRIGKESYVKINYDMQHYISEVSVEELNRIKGYIAESCRRAQEAGIDAIEVHGDRLLGSLCSEVLNHRTDAYGGCFENRVRYALEVVQAMKQAPPALMIEYKLPVITVNPDGSDRGKGGLKHGEAVEFAKLLEQGCTVTIVEMMDKIASGESSTILPTIMADFAKHGVVQYVNTKVSSIEDGVVKAVRGEEEISIPCDTVVMAVGSRKNTFCVEGVTVPVYYAGDYAGERTASIAEAIRGGYQAANQI